jgi:hypothetical protein
MTSRSPDNLEPGRHALGSTSDCSHLDALKVYQNPCRHKRVRCGEGHRAGVEESLPDPSPKAAAILLSSASAPNLS